jgi:uncharacterized protein (DUF1330 family)
MTAYLIADIDVTDPSEWDSYRKAVGPTIEQYGGRVIAGRARVEAFEGNWNPKTIVLVEFPSYERLKEWYDSPEYQEPKQTRIAPPRPISSSSKACSAFPIRIQPRSAPGCGVWAPLT